MWLRRKGQRSTNWSRGTRTVAALRYGLACRGGSSVGPGTEELPAVVVAEQEAKRPGRCTGRAGVGLPALMVARSSAAGERVATFTTRSPAGSAPAALVQLPAGLRSRSRRPTGRPRRGHLACALLHVDVYHRPLRRMGDAVSAASVAVLHGDQPDLTHPTKVPRIEPQPIGRLRGLNDRTVPTPQQRGGNRLQALAPCGYEPAATAQPARSPHNSPERRIYR